MPGKVYPLNFAPEASICTEQCPLVFNVKKTFKHCTVLPRMPSYLTLQMVLKDTHFEIHISDTHGDEFGKICLMNFEWLSNLLKAIFLQTLELRYFFQATQTTMAETRKRVAYRHMGKNFCLCYHRISIDRKDSHRSVEVVSRWKIYGAKKQTTEIIKVLAIFIFEGKNPAAIET